MTVAPAPPVPRPPRGLRHTLGQARREWTAYLFLAPGLILFSIFTVFALGFAFYLTFHEWSIIEPDKPFVGLDNYKDMVEDERFRRLAPALQVHPGFAASVNVRGAEEVEVMVRSR